MGRRWPRWGRGGKGGWLAIWAPAATVLQPVRPSNAARSTLCNINQPCRSGSDYLNASIGAREKHGRNRETAISQCRVEDSPPADQILPSSILGSAPEIALRFH